MNKRTIALLTALLMAVAIFAGCGGGKAGKGVGVDLRITDVALEDGAFTVNGVTDLPDGANLAYSFPPTAIEDDVTVQDGAWTVQETLADIEDAADDAAALDEGLGFWIGFAPRTAALDEGKNPAEVYEIYGDNGVDILNAENVETFGADDDITRQVMARVEIKMKDGAVVSTRPVSVAENTVLQFEKDMLAVQEPARAAIEDFVAAAEGSTRDARRAAATAGEECKRAQQACFQIVAPLVDKDVDVALTAIRMELSTAYMLKTEAFESALAYLDNNKREDLQEYEEKIADADRFMQSAAEYLAGAKTKAGIE